jgi:hypothetical protein
MTSEKWAYITMVALLALCIFLVVNCIGIAQVFWQ